ncbi:MAG: Calx-beta domain-containing protein, partial [Pyrinomonadaceae bacterium]
MAYVHNSPLCLRRYRLVSALKDRGRIKVLPLLRGRSSRLYIIGVLSLLAICLIATAFLPFDHTLASGSKVINNKKSFAPAQLSEHVSVRAVRRGDARLSLGEGRELITAHQGSAELQRALEQNEAQPLSLASADFDEDGMPDLASGYAHGGRGIVTVHRGNVDSIYPNAPEAQKRKADGTLTNAPFLSPALAIKVLTPADFLGAGDFDADGHWDIVCGSRGGNSLHFLPGDGQGGFGPAEAIELSGQLTAFAAADVNRRDGLTDVVIGVNTYDGPRLMIFEGPLGARKAQPETLALPAEASAVAVGELDDEYQFDLVVTAGQQLLIVHGRDRKISLPADARASVRSPEVTQREFPFALRDVAIGDFDDDSLSDIAVLAADGSVNLITQPAPSKQKVSKALREWPAEALGAESWPGATRLIVARVSSSPTDDLIVLDPSNRKLQIASRAGKQEGKSDEQNFTAAVEVSSEPVALLPMRLDIDALSDLVILTSGSGAPTVAFSNKKSSAAAEPVSVEYTGFSNTTSISITAGFSPPNAASPYPSTITVSGQPAVDKLRVRINNMSSSNTGGGLDLVLTGPGGQKVMLMSDVGSCCTISNATLTFDDQDRTLSGVRITSGNYAPTDVNTGTDTFPAPAPAGPYATALSTFNGTDPNGTWSLYAINDNFSDSFSGNIAGGWSLYFGQDSPITFVVTNTNDSGAGSLRQAIIDANAALGVDTITFNIPGPGVHTITPSSALPIIFDPVTIDATTQPGFAGQPLIELNGASAGSGASGLTITAGRTTVRGFVINRFSNGKAIEIYMRGNNIIEGNYLGTNSGGTALSANRTGVSLEQAGNLIGGTTAAARNIISGNSSEGIKFDTTNLSPASGAMIQGNFIGTDVTGAVRVANGVGISFRSAPGSGNNLIGGTTPGARNIISGSSGDNIDLAYSGSNGNLIQGNYIGTNAAGTASLSGSFGNGVSIGGAAHDTTVGGTTPAARNIISGNSGTGAAGVFIREENSTANLIQGNFIGTDVTGTLIVANTTGVLMIFSAAGNTIGGDANTVPGVRNIISGNKDAGIQIGEVNRATTLFNLIRGNYIGTDVTGNNPLGNGLNTSFGGDGIVIPANATGDTIQENRIAYNTGSAFFKTGNGIFIETPANTADSAGIRIKIIDNEIYGNSRLGIDLGTSGITPNDPGDGDTGPNNLQNFPVLTGLVLPPSADPEKQNQPKSHGQTVTINGTLNSVASSSYTVHWYFSTDSVCGNNQLASRPLVFGRVPGVTTDPGGNAAFNFPFTFPSGTSAGIINCTATDSVGNTSEFSACMPVTEVLPTLSINDISQVEGNSGPASFTFTVALSVASSQTITVNYATANNTAGTADGDYLLTSGILTFNPGETSKPITVTVNGDVKFEPNESFFVNLSNPGNATISDGQGAGTIQNDDLQPAISINDLSQSEGNSGTTPFTFAVGLSNPSSQIITVNYALVNGTATTADSDYTSIPAGTLTFNPGELSKPIAVPVNGDTKFESDETFVINLSNPANATIADNEGQGTIANDDSQPTVSINDVSLSEGNSGTTTFTFNASLSNASSQSVTVNYATADGSATAGSDYQSASGSVTFNPGETGKPLAVLVEGETSFESNETFVVNLTLPVNANMGDGQGQGTIVNDDAQPTISINDISQGEGNSSTTPFTFNIGLSNPSSQTVTLNYTTANNTATTTDGDYALTSGTVTFTPGDTSEPITVPINGDIKFELNETFFVNLSNPTNGAIGDGQGQGTVANDDLAPTIAINDVSQSEGNTGTTSFAFNVSLPNPSYQIITVNYTTAINTATTTDGDYSFTNGTATFNSGEISKPITVTVNGDMKFEPDENFFVNLSGPTNATISDGQGVGTIQNDDLPPTISINDLSQNEGDSGTTPFTFAVGLSNPSSQIITVNYALADGSATTTDNDYTLIPAGTLTFNPGEISKPIAVSVNGDTKFESDDTFVINLSGATNATIADNQGQGTIANDDSQPTASINDVSQSEGNSGTSTFTFNVNLTNPSAQTVTVNYATADGTASAGSDYQSASSTLTFNPGETSKPIAVLVEGETSFESNETFVVNLTLPVNATMGDGQGQGTIVNDDSQPTISINDVNLGEGNSGATSFNFNVILSNPSSQTVTVNYATANGTATTADNDYSSTNGTVTFNPGETGKPITVTVNGDVLNEPDEIFFVNLSAAVNATITDNQGSGNVTNDDALPSLSINDLSVAEGNSGTANATFNVTLSAPSGQTVSVNYATANSTATAGIDYESTTGTLTFDPGDTSKPVAVVINGDTAHEPNETFFVNVFGATNATIADNQGVGTITNDDAVPSLSLNDATANEGNTGTTTFTFTATLSNPSSQTVTVNYAMADGTAAAGSDYQNASGTLTFNPGDTNKPITVLVNGDALNEADETFFVNLSGATNAGITDNQGLGTITNDDAVPGLSINDVGVAEGNSGTTNATFNV